jgi:putative tricarboxylic transport membrane protein
MGILDGFVYLFSNPTALCFVALGAIVGIIVGALPGLTAAAAIAMLMPITF